MDKSMSSFVGLVIAIMILFNGTLSNAMGNYQATVLIHIIGLIGVLIVILIKDQNFRIIGKLPILYYTAGIIGVLPVVFNNIGFANLGVSMTMALVLLGQSLASLLFDHFGVMGMPITKFNNKKIIGLGLISVGIVIMAIS